MDETTVLFSEEPASVAMLAERWGLATHQLYYIIKSRRVPHIKVIGTTKFFDAAHQRDIFGAIHKYRDIDQIDLRAHSAGIEEEIAEEQEAMQVRITALEAEVANLKSTVAVMLKLLAQQGQDKAE
jgi:hypothetical protein